MSCEDHYCMSCNDVYCVSAVVPVLWHSFVNCRKWHVSKGGHRACWECCKNWQNFYWGKSYYKGMKERKTKRMSKAGRMKVIRICVHKWDATSTDLLACLNRFYILLYIFGYRRIILHQYPETGHSSPFSYWESVSY